MTDTKIDERPRVARGVHGRAGLVLVAAGLVAVATPIVDASPAAPVPATLADDVPGLQRIHLEWTVTVSDIPEKTSEAVIWVALPQVRPEQHVTNLQITCDHPWNMLYDRDFGNRVARLTATDPPPAIEIALSARIHRSSVRAPVPQELEPREHELYLRQEALVTLSDRVRALADSVGAEPRALYGYVLDHMRYDKSAPGWGRGDTERACDVGLGNCTDFHSLFISLARANGIPARFDMGITIEPGPEPGHTSGYHCWAWFHTDGAWVPVDISEADKHPERAGFYYGNLGADRVTFSTGRDVVLPGMHGQPLNYLPVSGYAEADGVPLASISHSIRYTVR